MSTPRSPEPVQTEVASSTTRLPVRLFVIPMILVVILVAIWLPIRWMLHPNDDPKSLVSNLQPINRDSWWSAYAMSRLLQSPDHQDLKDDSELCRQLVAILASDLTATATDESHVRLRVFLCRALGEFRVDDGLPVLVEAASSRPGAVMDVRYAALESIAILSDTLGRERVVSQARLIDVVLQASRVPTQAHSERETSKLRATAAFVLGVIGGPRARDRLARMLNDGHANTRYNAATGLARSGDERAIPVLLEMVDADAPAAVQGETTSASRALKRASVIVNGIRATVQLAHQIPQSDLAALRVAIDQLTVRSDLSSRLRMDAKRALVQLNGNSAGDDRLQGM